MTDRDFQQRKVFKVKSNLLGLVLTVCVLMAVGCGSEEPPGATETPSALTEIPSKTSAGHHEGHQHQDHPDGHEGHEHDQLDQAKDTATQAANDLADQLQGVADEHQPAAKDALAAVPPREALGPYLQGVADQLTKQEAGVQGLEAVASSDDDSGEWNELIQKLKTQLAAAKEKYGQIQSAESGDADTMKDQMGGMMEELTKLYEQAQAKAQSYKGDMAKKLQDATKDMKLPEMK